MATITLHTKTLIEAVGWGAPTDNTAEIEAAVPGYIERLRAACAAAGAELVVNRHDQATGSLADDGDGMLAQEIDQRVAFWG